MKITVEQSKGENIAVEGERQTVKGKKTSRIITFISTVFRSGIWLEPSYVWQAYSTTFLKGEEGG